MKLSTVFPISEVNAYRYVKDLAEHNRAATAASSFLQAWNFCVHVVGFDDPEDIGDSPRVKGAVHVQYMSKRMLKQKETLNVHMIVRMETTMFEMDGILTDVEKAVVGYCLFLLYGRGRSSDSQRIAAMDFDVGQDVDNTNDVAGFIEALSFEYQDCKEQRAEEDLSTLHSHFDIVVGNSMVGIVDWCKEETRFPRNFGEGRWQ